MDARPLARPKAVLFDLDGTLYDQRPLRRKMLMELLGSVVRSPIAGRRTIRHLRVFRRMREHLRVLGDSAPSLDRVQYSEPAAKIQDDAAALESTIVEWMHQRPLRHLAGAARPELHETLTRLKDQGLRLGVFSDYPPEDKLRALGVADCFDVALAATDPEVNAFKPHPRGFEVGAEKLGFHVTDVAYVGDRLDVDAAGAASVGMACVIVGDGGDHPGGAASGAHDRTGGQVPPAILRMVDRFTGIPEVLGCD